jgi:hypothetical protein
MTGRGSPNRRLLRGGLLGLRLLPDLLADLLVDDFIERRVFPSSSKPISLHLVAFGAKEA